MASVVDIFKVGVGPSSSHTVGPWIAALTFVEEIKSLKKSKEKYSIIVDLYGSLALTGVGHGTDFAVYMGLSGYPVDKVAEESIAIELQQFKWQKYISIDGKSVGFAPARQIRFWKEEFLPQHPNGLTFRLLDKDDHQIFEKTYYSIGGGFVVEKEELSLPDKVGEPHPLLSTKEIKAICLATGDELSRIIMNHENKIRPEAETRKMLLEVALAMLDCAYHGCHTRGVLPGGLEVERRAPAMHDRLNDGKTFDSPIDWLKHIRDQQYGFRKTIDWVSCIALAVNEQNADFRKVVTAPTNGAAGVVPSVLLYMQALLDKDTDKEDVIHFLTVAGYIGQLYKQGATISAAAGGCQAEIGVSASMAAGALTSVMGGTVDQVFMAAEIAMEHHLGLTCDPVGGLVQIPCIERNSIGAMKAITAAELALERDPSKAKVSLDDVIKSMWETAQDMHHKYKETSLGGLAINVSLPEC